MMRRLFIAFGIGVSSLTANAVEFPPDIWFTPCGGPEATCMAARASRLAGLPNEEMDDSVPPPCGRPAWKDALACADLQLTPIADPAREYLDRWQEASRTHLVVTVAERLRLSHADPARNGQKLDLTCELQGPVDAADLARRYHWTVTDASDTVDLTAIPSDPLERLFYERFTVTLDPVTWRPTTIRFLLDSGSRETVVLHPWVDPPEGVELAGFESSEESAPQGQTAERPIRTADLSGEPPHLSHDSASPLSLPPAPAPCEFAAPIEPVEAPRPTASQAELRTALRNVLERFDAITPEQSDVLWTSGSGAMNWCSMSKL